MNAKLIELNEILKELPEDKLIRVEGFIVGLVAGLTMKEPA